MIDFKNIDHTAASFTEALGISHERIGEIVDVIAQVLEIPNAEKVHDNGKAGIGADASDLLQANLTMSRALCRIMIHENLHGPIESHFAATLLPNIIDTIKAMTGKTTLAMSILETLDETNKLHLIHPNHIAAYHKIKPAFEAFKTRNPKFNDKQSMGTTVLKAIIMNKRSDEEIKNFLATGPIDFTADPNDAETREFDSGNFDQN